MRAISTSATSSAPRSNPAARAGLVLLLHASVPGCFDPEAGQDDFGTTTSTPEPGSTSSGPDDSTTGGTTTSSAEGSSTDVTTESGLDSSSGGDAVCGNGEIEGDEECDDGPDNGDTQACTSACRQATCGDGLVQAGEEGCDDEGESPSCDADCTVAACGDGIINAAAGEQCEQDGPGFDCSACVATCAPGTDDCNDDLLGDGCEADLTGTDTCGDCMTSCAMDEQCFSGTCSPPSLGLFLLAERDVPNIWQWDPITGTTSLYHSTDSNDADCNLPEGSPSAWIPWHETDYFGSFTPGTGTGLDVQFGTPYAYPKHITVFDGDVLVMSRNDATIFRYSQAGAQLLSLPTGNGTGQGMATDGAQVWASFWNGANSYFVRYDAALTPQEMIPNPTGLGGNVNVIDLAYAQGSGHFFGLVANFEQGTLTESNTVVEFEMGGSVLNTYNVPFLAEAIGQSECP